MNLSDPRAVCRHGVNLQSRCGMCFFEVTGMEDTPVSGKGQPSPYSDPISHPTHYTSHPSGVECIQITEHMGFCLGNAIKYLWRVGLKAGNSSVGDLKKAIWYIEREIKRLEGK